MEQGFLGVVQCRDGWVVNSWGLLFQCGQPGSVCVQPMGLFFLFFLGGWGVGGGGGLVVCIVLGGARPQV